MRVKNKYLPFCRACIGLKDYLEPSFNRALPRTFGVLLFIIFATLPGCGALHTYKVGSFNKEGIDRADVYFEGNWIAGKTELTATELRKSAFAHYRLNPYQAAWLWNEISSNPTEPATVNDASHVNFNMIIDFMDVQGHVLSFFVGKLYAFGGEPLSKHRISCDFRFAFRPPLILSRDKFNRYWLEECEVEKSTR